MTTRLLPIFVAVCSIIFIVSCTDKREKSNTDSLNTEGKSTMNNEKLKKFGEEYSKAWSSQKPESVASFFALNGSLSVNADAPAIGREAITSIAQGFMTAFPDMIVSMDSLVTRSNGIEFHWTLTGTNSVTGGTGNKVRVSGFELWQFDDDGLIRESKGQFDAEEYNRQLKYGVKE